MTSIKKSEEKQNKKIYIKKGKTRKKKNENQKKTEI